jgi:hypothetical protein
MLTPQIANVVVLEVTIGMLDRQILDSDKLTDAERHELEKAKYRLLERLRENLCYAKKQAK